MEEMELLESLQIKTLASYTTVHLLLLEQE
jgi:hypothetical protein